MLWTGLLVLLPLSGCITPPPPSKSAFTGAIERDFSAEVLKMPLFIDTTSNAEVLAKYKEDWRKILKTIVGYEDELQK